jgi:hypothetical protein
MTSKRIRIKCDLIAKAKEVTQEKDENEAINYIIENYCQLLANYESMTKSRDNLFLSIIKAKKKGSN